MYTEILCVLVSHGPLKLTQLTGKVELDKPKLIQIMSFLYDRCLVGEQNLDEDEKAYFITKRGQSVLNVMAPLVSEAQRIQMQNFKATSYALSSTNSKTIKEKYKK